MDLVFAPSQIESWPLDRLRPYARNAKIHDADQVAKIASSMAKFGWTVPCMVADDGELIAGHGRVLAAAMLGLKEVPVIRLSHLDEAERRAYRIADNQLAELSEWDEVVKRGEVAWLLAENFDRREPIWHPTLSRVRGRHCALKRTAARSFVGGVRAPSFLEGYHYAALLPAPPLSRVSAG